jgi:hypothetical protein
MREIGHAIVVVRGLRVLLDETLASLYGVPVKALNQAVSRNRERFPTDFMFQLSLAETHRLRSQFVTLDAESRTTTEEEGATRRRPGRGRHRKFRPFAFTEQGVAMLSSVLRSARAIRVNIEIVRAFVRLRALLHGHAELARKVAELESRYDGQFRVVFDAIRELMEEPAVPAHPIGFRGT